MIIVNENMSLWEFEAWSGAVETQRKILDENKCDEFDALIEECYPEGLTDCQLNDLLWFESDWIYANLGITEEDDDEDKGDEDIEEDKEEDNE